MIPLSRPLLPDELWWSGLARHAELVGLGSLVPRHTRLAGNRRSLGSPLFPRQLDAMLMVLDVPLSAEFVITHHTMIPLFKPFLQPRKIERATVAIRSNGNAEMTLGFTPMKEYAVALRSCPLCMSEDVALHGTATWRRSHQAAGAIVCFRHRAPLVQTTVSCRGTQFVSLTTADSATHAQNIDVPAAAREDAHRIAVSMHQILNCEVPFADQGQLAQLYRRRLRNAGLIDDHERLRLREFVAKFNQRLGPLLPLIGCCTPNAAERDNWLARLVRRPRSEQSPLRHILLMHFLGLEVASALEEASKLFPYSGMNTAKRVESVRSVRVTEERVKKKRVEWRMLQKNNPSGPLRKKNDTLYSWLWRNDREWLSKSVGAR